MLSVTRVSRRTALLVAGLTLLAPSAALAIAVVSWAYDPTRTSVYYQFSTDVPFDAQRSEVRTPAGVPAGAPSPLYKNPAGLAMGGNGLHTGLTPATAYVLRVYVQQAPGSAWVLVKAQGFTTDP